MFPRVLYALAALLLAGVAFAAGFLASEAGQAIQASLERQADQQLQEAPPVEVACLPLVPRPWRERLEHTGTVAAWREARLAFAETGLVAAIAAREGAAVAGPGGEEPGQELARLDPDRFAAAAAAARADLAQARWEEEQVARLFAQGTASEDERKRTALLAALKAAELVRAEKALEDTVLRAPFAGVLAARYVETGEAASPAAPAFRLVQLDPAKAVVHVPGRRIGEVAPGQEAEVEVETAPGAVTRRAGRVHLVLPAAAAHLFPVEIAVPNGDGILREGMLLKARIYTRETPALFVLPLEAVMEHDGRRLAMVLEPKARVAAGRFDLGLLPPARRAEACRALGLDPAGAGWHDVPAPRWAAAGLTARERLGCRSAGAGAPAGPGAAVWREGSVARERALPAARLEGDVCLVPADGSLREGELLIVRGQHRVADGAEVILAHRNELADPGEAEGGR